MKTNVEHLPKIQVDDIQFGSALVHGIVVHQGQVIQLRTGAEDGQEVHPPTKGPIALNPYRTCQDS